MKIEDAAVNLRLVHDSERMHRCQQRLLDLAKKRVLVDRPDVSTATSTTPHGVLVLTGSVDARIESLLVGHAVDVSLRAVGLVGRLRRVRPAVLRGTS